MMEAASTSEISVNFYQTTRRNIPEDSRRKNLKYHPDAGVFLSLPTTLHFLWAFKWLFEKQSFKVGVDSYRRVHRYRNCVWANTSTHCVHTMHHNKDEGFGWLVHSTGDLQDWFLHPFTPATLSAGKSESPVSCVCLPVKPTFCTNP
jgi:hypothetical protein